MISLVYLSGVFGILTWAETVNQTPEFEKARKVLNIELDKILKEQK